MGEILEELFLDLEVAFLDLAGDSQYHCLLEGRVETQVFGKYGLHFGGHRILGLGRILGFLLSIEGRDSFG